jgi:hypothetical protein
MQHDRPAYLPAAAELAFARGIALLKSRLMPDERMLDVVASASRR